MYTIETPRQFHRNWVEKNPLPRHAAREGIKLDFAKTTRIDSAGAAFVHQLNRRCRETGQSLTIANISGDLLETLQSWRPGDKERPSKPASRGLSIERIGAAAVNWWTSARAAVAILSEMVYWGGWGIIKSRTIRKGSLFEQMYQLGFRAFGIVALLSFLIGIVLSLQTAIQLKTYGAGIFLAPVIGILMVRELGPMLTAIILAGRTGSATTAEIATMSVQEELDALQTMGINPIQFVVVPKFWAITITMPVLSILATAAGIFGGFCIALFYLSVPFDLFWRELVKNLYFRDVSAGFLKSVVFSWLIIWVGAFFGLRVRGGAEEVGKATTSSVVTGIFAIIISDALFSFII